jgi:hypothetical protein
MGDAIRAAVRTAGGQPESAGLTPASSPLPIDLRRGAADLRSQFNQWERLVTFVLAIVFAAVALGTIYVEPVWGSYGDFLAAFLIGFAAYAGTAPGIGALLTAARTRPA